jgi:triacylglycerol lipase
MYDFLATALLAVISPSDLSTAPTSEPACECVVLLHGLGRGPGSMRAIERRLVAAGYVTWNEGYPSRRATIEDLAEQHVGPALERCRSAGAARVHFVTHSLGGILVRQDLHGRAVADVGRVVMLSPPNGGSEVAERLGGFALYEWLMGPAALQLGTGANSIPRRLGTLAAAEVGIITGSRSLDPWFGSWLPRPHDGKVSVESARLEGMSDFRVVERAHGLIMRDAGVVEDVLHFLEHGRFSGAAAGAVQSR